MSDAIHKMMKENNYQSKYKELVAESMQDEDVQAFLRENEERLTSESIVRSSANIYEFVQEKKKILSNKKGIAPGFYPKLVINKNHIDVTYIPSEEKHQEMMNLAKKNRVKTYYMPKNIQEVSLAQIDATVERADLLNHVYQFIEEYIQAPQNFHRGLYLHGRFGVGKTYILGAMANELASHGYESAMVHFPSFSYEVKQAISDNTTSEKIEPLRQAPILVVDDIGADSMSSWL
ncbi:MAG: primosomal protein DnaI, partial [Tissierellia bacterium]|nr:primosomal protein DnaI [Tissierellia bacterium]